MRKQIFEIIEYADNAGPLGKAYDYAMMVVIAVSLLPLAFKTEPPLLVWVDWIAEVIFILDYLLRLITADYFMKKKSLSSFLRYPLTPYATIDLLSTLPFFLQFREGWRLLRLLRVLRAFRVFRVLKALHYSKSVMTIVRVFRKQKAPLLAVAILGAGYIMCSALLMYHVEPESFPRFFDAVYWSTASIAALASTDIVPVTAIGRMVAIVSALFGLAIIALPAGIISVGYMDECKACKEEATL